MFLFSLFGLVFFIVLAVVALILFNFALGRFFEGLAPPQGRFIEVDGLRLHVVDSGESPGQSAPPLFLVHGMLGQLNHFTYALAALFPERRVVMMDRPGSGYSQAARSQGVKAQAEIAAKVIDQLGLKKPLAVGHSLGGAVVLALALGHGEKLGGLALIAPLTHPVPSPFKAALMKSRLALWLMAWTFGPLVSLLQAANVGDRVFAPDPTPLRFWNRAGGLLATRPSAIIAATRELSEVPPEMREMSARYAALAMPVGVLFGKGDVVIDPKAQGLDFCAKAPEANLTMVDGGHMLPVTQPKVVEDFIRKMIGRIQGGVQ